MEEGGDADFLLPRWLRELEESCDISDWLNEAAGTQQEGSWSEALAEAQTLLTWVFRDM